MFVQSIFHLLLGGGGQRLIGSMLRCFTFNLFRRSGDVQYYLMDLNPVLVGGKAFLKNKDGKYFLIEIKFYNFEVI